MSLLENPLIKNFIKGKLPEIIDNLDSLESGLVDYIKSHDLKPDETHIALFTEITADGKAYLCIGAFNKREMVRLIEAKPAKEFIKSLMTNALN